MKNLKEIRHTKTVGVLRQAQYPQSRTIGSGAVNKKAKSYRFQSKFKIIQIFAILLTFVFASCSNLLDKTSLESSSSSENQNASLVINLKSQSRYIAALDYDISEINSWALVYSQEDIESPTTKAIAWLNGSSTTSSPSLTYSSENQTLTINGIPSGTYTIAITGKKVSLPTSSDSSISTSIELVGTATGVKISNDFPNTEIYLGLKKSASGSGTFSLTLTDSENQFDNYYSSLQITLKNIFDDTKYYMKDPSGVTTSTLKLEKSSEQSSDSSTVYILSNAEGTTITSGFYQLIFYIDDSKRVYVPADKSIIEIADGIETSGETEIFLSRSKTYYSTNDKNALGNGLSKSSRANLSTLLNKLAQDFPDESEINICADDVPEINIDSLEKIKSTLLGKDSKYISIYDKTQSEILLSKTSDSSDVSAKPSLMIASNTDETGGSSESTVLVDISGALTLTAGEETQASANVISVSIDSPYKITLKNGARLSIFGDVGNSFSGTLQISLVQEDEGSNLTDNFVAYFVKPFIEFAKSSISSDKFALYDSQNQQVTNWNVKQKDLSSATYQYYLVPQNQSQLSSAQNNSDTQIVANFSGDSQTTYSSASTIPYKYETLEFTLFNVSTGVNFSTEVTANHAWFLEENLCQSSSQSDLVKLSYDTSNLKNAKTYNLSCYFISDEKIYKCDFELEFEKLTASAAVYLDAINYTQSDSFYYNLKQVKDYKVSDSSLDFIEQYASTSYSTATVSAPIYTFDSNFSFIEVRTPSDSSPNFSKFLMNSKTGLYDSGLAMTVNEEISNKTIKDISFDVSSEFLFVLAEDSSSSSPQNYIYAVKDGILYSSSEFTITNEDTSTSVSQIAVYKDKIYLAGDNCNIYEASFALNDETKTITTSDFELFTSCADSKILSDYDSTLHSANYDKISISDLQLGDGLGNGIEKLYVLVREETKTLNSSYLTRINVDSSDDTKTYCAVFSRGALLGIDTSTKDLKTYGWAANYQDKSENKVRYFGPSSEDDSSSVEFYGPSRFAAVVPKKLVILDDGFYIDGLSTEAATSGYSIVKNKDSFVEFDIEGSALTRGDENISATKPSVSSGFTAE